ncbi:MAG: CPBP family intramembrane metalloprotease [Candidatus Dormibacteraeota bacterium]|nr:CPBP family intramembrane metalloprotease [Candidatus Dormibacteraeota bacterium]
MSQAAVRVIPGHTADTLRWVLPDLATRLVPFGVAVAVVALVWHPAWLGLTLGDVRVQVGFGVLAFPIMFGLAALIQLPLSRRRGALKVPDVPDALLQGGYYVLNGPLEEGLFRGIVQGGVGALLGAPAGFLVGTLSYVLYHRLGGWQWLDVAATALAGIPLGLAFWLLPGPHSLLGVSIAHIGATCGFLGPGPFLLRRLRLL